MAHLLIIELPGGNDTDIVRCAIDLGHEVTFLSAQLGHYQRQPQVAAVLAEVRQRIEVPGFAYAEVEQRVLAVHVEHRIDAVLCLIDIRLTEAARLAHRLGLRHLNPASAALLRDKFSVRSRLLECGLAQPDFALAETNAQVREAVERLGLPVLIKPADGYGSQNIVVLREPEDLDPLLSPLDEMLPCRADYGLGVRANDRLLVERYMAGSFIGCDTFTADGQHWMLGVHEKLLFAPPSFAMRGSCFTPDGPEFAAIADYAFALLEAVGFDCGAAHIEMMLTADGPRLVEINPRLVGAKMPRLIGYALGRSLHADLIAVHLGQSLPVAVPAQRTVGVLRWVVADRAGALDHVDLPSLDDPRIRCVEMLKKAGDAVRPPFDNADRIGYVMVCDPVRSEAEQLADRVVAEATVRLQADAAELAAA
jgi:biotin carboxylase